MLNTTTIQIDKNYKIKKNVLVTHYNIMPQLIAENVIGSSKSCFQSIKHLNIVLIKYS